MKETSREAVAKELHTAISESTMVTMVNHLDSPDEVDYRETEFTVSGSVNFYALAKAVLKKYDPLRVANRIMGQQGDTIHVLRAEIAEVRSLSSKAERGDIRRLERDNEALQQDLALALNEIKTLRDKLDDGSEEDLVAVAASESTELD